MKKYRLKKDLPTFKAGDKFYINECGDLVLDVPLSNNCQTEYGNTVYFAEALEHFPDILTNWFEEIPEEPKTVFDLEGDMLCWVVGTDSVYKMEWCNIPFVVEKRAVGDIVMTEEEGLKKIARRKAEVILERDTKGFKPDWSNKDQRKWFVIYDHANECLDTSWDDDYQYPSALYFATEEDTIKSISRHEKEWKIYLGVEE